MIYVMNLLSDNEFFEGILGGFGWIVAIYYIRHSLKNKKNSNIALIGFFSWAILWYIRKIGMNLYKDSKNTYGIKNRYFDLDHLGKANIFQYIFVNIFFLLLIYFVVVRDAHSLNREILNASKKMDIPILMFFLFIAVLVIFH